MTVNKQKHQYILRKTSSQIFDLIIFLLQHLLKVLEWRCLTHFLLQFLQCTENSRRDFTAADIRGWLCTATTMRSCYKKMWNQNTGMLMTATLRQPFTENVNFCD